MNPVRSRDRFANNIIFNQMYGRCNKTDSQIYPRSQSASNGMKLDYRNGFIAITSAVVIAVLLMSVTLSLSLTGFFARFNILDMEYKERGTSLAESCVEVAMLKLANDRGYRITNPPGEAVSLGGLNCEIFSVGESGGQITIKTRAYFPQSGTNRTATNIVVVVRTADLGIVSWEEVPIQT